MLRISGPYRDGTSATLRAEGRIVDAWVELLDQVSRRVSADGLRTVIDLRHVTFVDEAGARMLKRLVGDGVELVNPSTYVVVLLDRDGA